MYIKYSELSRIVLNEVEEARIADEYMGGRGENLKENLLIELQDVRNGVIVKCDLRPSEYKIIDSMEVKITGKLVDCVEEFKIREFKKGLRC
jgi:phosphotransacetylase